MVKKFVPFRHTKFEEFLLKYAVKGCGWNGSYFVKVFVCTAVFYKKVACFLMFGFALVK